VRHPSRRALTAVFAVLVGACSPKEIHQPVSGSLQVSSKSITAGVISNDCGCNGAGTSPQISWTDPPPGTQSFAVTIYDPDAPAGAGWWHWMVFNIPATVHSLAAGAGNEGSKDLPAGAGQGRNDFGLSLYSGPCPPVGDHAHHYEITVYAVKVARLPLDNTASGAAVSSQLRSNTLATAKIVGRYERSK